MCIERDKTLKLKPYLDNDHINLKNDLMEVAKDWPGVKNLNIWYYNTTR